ncbi:MULTISPECIES: RHS repeat domain-containing protein [unclassified Treponema]|uniref:RHS repeat domain-containing protein n=1 Tax=unclassified Treponema TaxID=2638727 RepID=UPI0020A3366E|nr:MULTISPECIES: RHS repeat-associated core domain-containing protein [unclassified Treponema]
MKISYYSQLNYLPRTAIGREQKQFIKIAFAVHLSAVISAERYRSDSGALKSAMLTLVYFYIIMIVHKCQQSAKRKLLLNKNSLSEVFPLTVGNGKTMAFENRHDGCKEREKINRRRTLCTLRINFFEATPQTACIFSKEVEGYINTSSKYETSQSYSYDNLYQLIKAEGTHKQYGGINPNPDNPHPSNPLHTNKYRQTFAFDIIGNMTNKSSTTNIQGGSISSDDTKLNYEPDYEYDSKYAHRLIRAGNRYYRYDANGNITAEKDGSFTDKEDFTFTYSYFAEHDVYGVDYGFDLEPPEDDPANLESGGTTSTTPTGGYRRDYTWNERNLLIKSDDKLNTVIYRYGDDGQRALKFTQQSNSETLYFNNFYSVHQVAHEPNHEHGLRVSKHIFVGNSRLVTAMTHADNHGDTTEQTEKRYYYHADHLQSAQFITDVRGEQYEHIEYTPYGELWIEETAPGIDKLPFRFTGKELDEETGLYYYGARYLDPKYSRWLSGDPALNDYIPKAPIDDEAKKHNENLPGIGGVYNTINLHVYHYAGNNPVKYTDPDGRDIILLNRSYGAGGFGHNAVLIGNDTDGWYYYSKDGKADGNQNGIRFDNLNAFRQANNKVVGKNNEYGASFNYDKGYQLKTTPEEDAQMQAYAAGSR